MENKKMSLWKKVLIVILFLLLVLIILTTRKVMIISDLANKSKVYDSKTNYLATVLSLENGNVNILKSYNKDGNYLTTIRVLGKDIQKERGLTIYKKDNEVIGIIQSGEEKIALLNQDMVGGKIQIVSILPMIDSDILQKIQFALISRITTEQYNNTDCYLIELDNYKIWVDKESGLTLKEENNGMTSERFYEFDIVKEENILKPDISSCKIKE